MRKKFSLVMLVVIFATMLNAGEPDNMIDAVPGRHVALQETTSGYIVNATLGACAYNGFTGDFYAILYGSSGQSIRKFTPDVFGPVYYEPTDVVDDDPGYPSTIDEVNGTSWMHASASDLPRIANAEWDVSTGVTDFDLGGYINGSGFIINPAPVTVNGISYDAGELALITQNGFVRHYDDSGTTRIYEHDYNKIAMLYDLRRIGSPTTELPDYDNGQDGLGGTGELWGAFGQADWNDVFLPLASATMLFDVTKPYIENSELAVLDYTSSQGFNFGRQGCWASDASAVYFAGHLSFYDTLEDDPGEFTKTQYKGGIYKVNMSDLSIELLYRDEKSWSAPCVLHTSVRDFTGGTRTGDQIIFEGSPQTGNEGGLVCVVDDGTDDQTVYVVADAEVLADLRGNAPFDNDNIRAVTADPEGNVYFFIAGGSYCVYQCDTEGRIIALNSRAARICRNEAKNYFSLSSMGLRLQYHSDVYGYPMLTFQDQAPSADCIGGLIVNKPGDFDRDGDLDIDDLNFFRDQRIYGETLTIALEDPQDPESDTYIPELNYSEGSAATLDYIKADVNASGVDYQKVDGDYYAENKFVDILDARVLHQYVTPGDCNLDGVVDMTDYNTFMNGYPKVDAGTTYSWTDGDFSLDGKVDSEDAALFAANSDFDMLYPLLVVGDLSYDNTVDYADIGLFSAGYPEVEAGYVSSWAEGDFNEDGDVTVADLMLLIENWLINK
jgi:hypothetical protein